MSDEGPLGEHRRNDAEHVARNRAPQVPTWGAAGRDIVYGAHACGPDPGAKATAKWMRRRQCNEPICRMRPHVWTPVDYEYVIL